MNTDRFRSNFRIRVLLSYIFFIANGTFLVVPVEAQSKKETNTFQFDDVIYTVPDGWRTGKTRDDYTTVYSSKSPVPTVRIYRSGKVHPSIRRWMEKRAIASFDEDDQDDAKATNYRTLEQGKQTFHMLGVNSGREMRIALVAEGKEKTNLFILALRVPRGRADALKTTKSVTATFIKFCVGAKFISEGAQPLLGKPVAGELQGAWFGLVYTYNLDLSTNFEQQFFVFSKEGRFYKGLPKGDAVANLDFEEAIRRHPDKAGNYRVDNGKITLQFANGKTDTKHLKSQRNKSAQALTKAKIPTDGTTFDGFYKDMHFSGFTPGSGVSGGVTHEKTYTFTSSGRFKATAFRGAFGSFSGGGFSSGTASPKVNGTYKVEGGRLVLTDSKGKHAVCSIVEVGEKLLFINGDPFLKSDSK